MYYDEQTRQLNFASGIALGALLGVGLALMFAPRRPPPLLPDARTLRRGAKRVRSRVDGAGATLRGAVARGVELVSGD
jgi:hypothetical protein